MLHVIVPEEFYRRRGLLAPESPEVATEAAVLGHFELWLRELPPEVKMQWLEEAMPNGYDGDLAIEWKSRDLAIARYLIDNPNMVTPAARHLSPTVREIVEGWSKECVVREAKAIARTLSKERLWNWERKVGSLTDFAIDGCFSPATGVSDRSQWLCRGLREVGGTCMCP